LQRVPGEVVDLLSGDEAGCREHPHAVMRRGEIIEAGTAAWRIECPGPAGERHCISGDERMGRERGEREVVDEVGLVFTAAEV